MDTKCKQCTGAGYIRILDTPAINDKCPSCGGSGIASDIAKAVKSDTKKDIDECFDIEPL